MGWASQQTFISFIMNACVSTFLLKLLSWHVRILLDNDNSDRTQPDWFNQSPPDSPPECLQPPTSQLTQTKILIIFENGGQTTITFLFTGISS